MKLPHPHINVDHEINRGKKGIAINEGDDLMIYGK
jgi:hypothetical protein